MIALGNYSCNNILYKEVNALIFVSIVSMLNHIASHSNNSSFQIPLTFFEATV